MATLENLASNALLFDPAVAGAPAANATGAAVDEEGRAASSSCPDVAPADAAAADAAAANAADEMDCDGRGDDHGPNFEEMAAAGDSVGGAVVPDGGGAGGEGGAGAAATTIVNVPARSLSQMNPGQLRPVIEALVASGELARDALNKVRGAKVMRAMIRPIWLKAYLERLSAESVPTTDLAKTCALLKRVAAGDFSDVEDQGALAPCGEEEDEFAASTAAAFSDVRAPPGYEFVEEPPAVGASPRRLFITPLQRCGASST
jgi:hypothetical protein